MKLRKTTREKGNRSNENDIDDTESQIVIDHENRDKQKE